MHSDLRVGIVYAVHNGAAVPVVGKRIVRNAAAHVTKVEDIFVLRTYTSSLGKRRYFCGIPEKIYRGQLNDDICLGSTLSGQTYYYGCGRVIVGSAGNVSNCTFNNVGDGAMSGALIVNSYGTLSGCRFDGVSGYSGRATVTLRSGTVTGLDIGDTVTVTVCSGVTVSGMTSDGHTTYQQQQNHIYVRSGGTINNLTLGDGDSLDVASGGTVTNLTYNGTNTISGSGTITDTSANAVPNQTSNVSWQ